VRANAFEPKALMRECEKRAISDICNGRTRLKKFSTISNTVLDHA